MGEGDTTQDSNRTIPSSIRHKQILDQGAEQPDASFEEIADEVPSATADLVETVFERYGDPAAETESTSTAAVSAASPPEMGQEPENPIESDSTPAQSFELTPRQEEILQAIAAHPEASQRKIGEQLGITGATVCNHMSQIEDNAWENRHQIITDALAPSASSMTGETLPTAADGSGVAPEDGKPTTATDVEDTDQIKQLQARIETLEQELASDQTSSDELSTISDPELMQKVLHVCLKAETISEDEELELIKALM